MLATANGAGYRFGTSDQAFYVPVVARALDSGLFPRDAALIDAQGRLMLADEVLAAVMRATGASMETVFFVSYLLSLALLWTAVALIGSRIYRHPWLTFALGAALTLRHRIPRTSANSFEPYFHPRMLAFGFGLMAVAALLRRRIWPAIALVGVAAVVHVTTALWFAVLVGAAIVVLEPRVRPLAAGAGVAGAIVAGWMLIAGPLRDSLTVMDEVWLQAVASKDSLFASQWPVWAWLANLALLAVLWWAHRTRQARGDATPEDRALAIGAAALVAVFLVTLPLVIARAAFPVQLQISRVFWLVDVVATIYVLAALFDRPGTALPRIATAVLIALSVGRGAYIMLVERPDRPLFGIHAPASPWEDAMAWIRRQPHDVHVLADPGHAWKEGTSVRVAARRDVFLEDVKDSAIAIYSRDVAARVVERMQAMGDFGALTPDAARRLAAQYDLDYLVAEADLPLPEVHRNERFRIYRLSEGR